MNKLLTTLLLTIFAIFTMFGTSFAIDKITIIAGDTPLRVQTVDLSDERTTPKGGYKFIKTLFNEHVKPGDKLVLNGKLYRMKYGIWGISVMSPYGVLYRTAITPNNPPVHELEINLKTRKITFFNADGIPMDMN